MTLKIAVLSGDGIGVEVTREAVNVLQCVNRKYGLGIETQTALAGGCAYDEYGSPLPDETMELAMSADAVLLGAVGGPKWEQIDYSVRPERALLGLRAGLDLFANLRPARVYSELLDSSSSE